MVCAVHRGCVENCISTSATLQFFTVIGPIKPMNYPVRTVFMLMLGFSSKYTTKQTPNRMFSSLFLVLCCVSHSVGFFDAFFSKETNMRKLSGMLRETASVDQPLPMAVVMHKWRLCKRCMSTQHNWSDYDGYKFPDNHKLQISSSWC